MKRASLAFILFFIGLFSACAGIKQAESNSVNTPQETTVQSPAAPQSAPQSVAQPLPSPTPPPPTNTPLPLPDPTETAIQRPTSQFTPTADPACNSAELQAQTISESEITPGLELSLTFVLINSGTCVWTTDYAIVLLANPGMEITEQQYFPVVTAPGETTEIFIRLIAPETQGSFTVVWTLQSDKGEFFGIGAVDDLIVLTFSVIEEVVVNEPSLQVLSGEVCTASSSNKSLPRYARLMHDPQWMPWPSRMGDPDWPNGYYYDWYPETVQLWTKPKGGDGRYTYTLPWLKFLRDIQPNDEAAVWIARIAAGLFNRNNAYVPILNLDQVTSLPKAEGISSGGNLIKILEIKNNSGRIEMLNVAHSPPNFLAINYFKTPWLITKFTSVSRDGELGNAGGIDVYFPNLAKQEEGYWVDLERVEMFPLLPLCASIQTNVNVHISPSFYAPPIGVLTVGKQVMIREYIFVGSDVWGGVRDGWIPLVFQVDGQPIYSTSWSMETRPPIVFSD